MSSVGSFISVIGVIVYFYMVVDAVEANTTFFQKCNKYYITAYNKFLWKNFSNFSFTKNLYIFRKYNFFAIYDKNYHFLDRFILSIFQYTAAEFNIYSPNMLKFFNFKIKYVPYLKLMEILKIDYLNIFLNTLILLISGWVSIFMGFFISRTLGIEILKLSFYGVIVKFFLQSAPCSISSILVYIIRTTRFKTILKIYE